ncbi:hypothetical protein HY639_03660 [Candidatus Woesearchaeota archaeon]|nr:hypothetical protein [Candidatus Woesearchaeota archaeon]
MKTLWEILVPRYSNKGEEYPLSHHHAWDEKVKAIAGGMTILKPAKGHWVNPHGKLFSEEMIPVRIYCTEQEIDLIIDMTLVHYGQEAVMAYELSSHVKMRRKHQ